MLFKRKKNKNQSAGWRTKTKKNCGFTLIEALVFLFIFVLITVTFYRVYAVGTRFIIDSKNRLGALSVANEKMEIVRNLKYDSVGTIHGTVSGSIPESEDVVENTKQYKVETSVIYIDDPLDGLEYADTVWFEDYKQVTIVVSWNGGTGGQESVQLVSRFVPPGLEVKHTGDGILVINVFSDQPGGTGIPNSTVHVANSDTGLDNTYHTDDTGNITLMGDKIRDSIQKYQISLSKEGYENVSTMPPYPQTPLYNPVDVHASVVTGSVNVANIVQNRLAQLKVDTVNFLDNPIPSIDFHLTGGRKLGTLAVEPNNPIYNMDADGKTNAGGEKDFGQVSPGQYAFTLLPSVISYALIDTDPVSPFSIFSDQDLALKVKLADKNATSLLVKTVRDDGGSLVPVPGATIELKNASGYDVTQTASATGTAFFPTTSDTFQADNYDLKITAAGFSDNNSQVTVDAGQLKTDTVTLIAS